MKKQAFGLWLMVGVFLCSAVGIVLGAMLYAWILELDIPTWMKVILLR